MTDTRAATMRTSLARLLVLAGALAGLLAMHGLGDHSAAHAGVPHARAPSMSHMSHALGVDGMARMGADSDAVAPVSSGAAVVPVGTSSGTDMGAMALCLAVLAGALLCLVRRASTGAVVRRAQQVGRLTAALATTSRERDPPGLAELSILRC